jgi:hypothetical protein
MKKNVPSTDPNGDAKRQLLEKAEHLMIVKITNLKSMVFSLCMKFVLFI